MNKRFFVTDANKYVVHESPTLDHTAILLMGIGASITQIRRYTYEDIIRVPDFSQCSKKQYPFRIFGATGAVVWQDVTHKGAMLKEFYSRCNPFIPVAQRAIYAEMVKGYGNADIAKAVTHIYGIRSEG